MHSEDLIIKSRLVEKAERVNYKPIDTNQELVECGSDQLPEHEEDHQHLGFWTSNNPNLTFNQFNDFFIQKFDSRPLTKVPFELKNKNEQHLIGIKIEVPNDATSGEIINIDVIKRTKPLCFLKKNKTVGGIAIQIKVCE